MKLMRKAPAVVAAMALALTGALTACGGGSSSVDSDCSPKHEDIQTVAGGKVTVGVTDTPPFSSYNSGDPKGIDIDILKKFTKENCLEPVWQQATYADMVQSINSGTMDLATGDINRTESRLKAVDFSDTIYLDGLGIVTKDGAKTIKDIESAKSVGTVDGYLWVDDLRKILGKKFKTYPSSVELKADFDAGRLAVAIDAYGTAAKSFEDTDGVSVEMANKSPDKRVKATVKSPQSGFPLTKGNKSLNKAVSDSVKSMRKDGDIKDLLKKQKLDPALAGDEKELADVYAVK